MPIDLILLVHFQTQTDSSAKSPPPWAQSLPLRLRPPQPRRRCLFSWNLISAKIIVLQVFFLL